MNFIYDWSRKFNLKISNWKNIYKVYTVDQTFIFCWLNTS